MSGGNLSGVYHFYTMAVTAATLVYISREISIEHPGVGLACAAGVMKNQMWW